MDNTSQIGDFTIFGFTKEPNGYMQRRVSEGLGVTPRVFNFNDIGSLFFYTTYGEVAESEDALALKLGFLRSPEMNSLSAQQLLEDHFVKPGAIDSGQLRGNALVACLGKKECSFSVFKTLLSVPQLYFSQVDGGVICSDRLKCIIRLVDRIELNEDIIPMHFLFRSVPGDLTYYRDIRRLLPGEFLRWTDEEISLNLVQDFRFTNNPDRAYPNGEYSFKSLYETLQRIVGDYVSQVERKGGRLATLLSGGVDSSLLQYLFNEQTSHPPSRSYSFAVRVPSFSYEIKYAQQASQFFKTEHTFVDIQPEDYPGLLTRTIDALAQPPILETEPSMLSIAEFAQAGKLPSRYFISGQGADTVFGLTSSRKLRGLHIANQMPGAALILKAMGSVLRPFGRVSQMLLKGGDILDCADDPDTFLSPANSIVVYVDIDILRRYFGDDALHNALRFRRELAARYLETDHYLEKIHVIDLITDTYELGVQRQQLFLSKEREKIHPFFDDDILRTAFAIHPDSRYIKGLRPKYLLKDLLKQKTGAVAANKPKGFSIWEADLFAWMKSGPLRPMVEEIKLPGFITKSEFDNLLDKPDYFLWVLLNFDLFKRRCLN
jgi:asparagine synthetase B (glutamine-hydrolysing)